MSTPTPLVAGALLAGRYQLDHPIASGGFGDVWRGTDVVLARPVAVKLLRAEFAADPATLARFRDEAQHAGALAHENIVRVYDYDELGQERLPFLVMEYIDGPSLGEVLSGGPLQPGVATDILAQAAAGLHAAHEAGLVHRDIKPQNVLLTAAGEVKLTDFGIARAMEAAPLTMPGTLFGTPEYLAPERASGGRGTQATDLYALGILAYQCLAGTAPFTGAPLEVAMAHRDEPLPPLPPGVPDDVAGLVRRLTAKDPADRPVSAAQVAAEARALRDAKQGSEYAGGPDTRWARSAARSGRSTPGRRVRGRPGVRGGRGACGRRPGRRAAGRAPARTRQPSRQPPRPAIRPGATRSRGLPPRRCGWGGHGGPAGWCWRARHWRSPRWPRSR